MVCGVTSADVEVEAFGAFAAPGIREQVLQFAKTLVARAQVDGTVPDLFQTRPFGPSTGHAEAKAAQPQPFAPVFAYSATGPNKDTWTPLIREGTQVAACHCLI